MTTATQVQLVLTSILIQRTVKCSSNLIIVFSSFFMGMAGSVSEVRISDCEGMECQLKIGGNITVEVDFFPGTVKQ